MDPYAQPDAYHEKEEAAQWDKSIEIDRRAAEIMADPNLLDEAVGDQVYGAIPFNPEAFIKARWNLAVAKNIPDITAAAKAFQKQLERIAYKQAEDELSGTEHVPMFLRKQAE